MLVCLALFGLLSLFGCQDKPNADAQRSTEYAIDKPFYKGPVSVHIRLSDENIKLSDLLDMELSATTDPDYTIQFPAAADTLKQFKILSFKELPQTFTDSGNIVKTVRYQLEPLELGMCEIPAFTFTFERRGSSDQDASEGTLETEPLWIDVSTSLPADPNAIALADIEDVVEMKADYTWAWIGLGVVCLLAAGIGLGMAVKPKKSIQIRRVYKPAHEIAFEVLRAIAGEKLVEQGRIKEFYEKLSACLRQYIENRFQLRAPEQTTEEFLEQLKTSDALKPEYKLELRKFLEHCDLVKFARYQPSDEQINESLTMAEEFVEKTKSLEHMVDITPNSQVERQVAS
jgi:hypothetical protein